MKKSAWKVYAIWILIAEGIGALSGYLTREGAKAYGETIVRPALSPPSVVFPIVWGILFALMGVSAARIYLSPPSPLRSRGLLLFFVQIAFNFFWSILFFNFQAFGLSLIWLLILWGLIL